jgi:hypothetical protein
MLRRSKEVCSQSGSLYWCVALKPQLAIEHSGFGRILPMAISRSSAALAL